jgi:hypothetical protein
MRIKQGTTIPYGYQIKDGEKKPIDLTDAVSVTITGTKIHATTPTINGACEFIDRATGMISYPWKDGETSTLGMFRIEFDILWTGGKHEKVPSNGEEWLLILSSNSS